MSKIPYPDLPEGLLEVMKVAALEAGHNALRCKADGLSSELKDDQSILTIADTQGEGIIHSHLDHYGFDFIGEETGETITGSDFAFVVDPIDGTTNFSVNDPDWLVSIGVTYKGSPIAGVTYQPELDKLYFAESGKGSYLTQHDNTEKLERTNKEPAAYVFDILSNNPLWTEVSSLHHILSEEITNYTEGKQKPRYRSTGCPSVPLCQMAEGARSGTICWPIALHDVAASMVIAEEAGIKVELHKNERKDSPYNYEIVAAIPQLFEQTLEAFKSVTGRLAHFYRGRDEDGVVEEMEKDGIKYGVSVGRRQPMHAAHLDCIKEMADAGLEPVIVIGSSNNADNPLYNPIENPLNESQQLAQIDVAMKQLGVDNYKILSLPDLGSMEEWASSLRHVLKANGIDPTQSVCHYRAKDDMAKDSANLVKPMKASNEALMRFGMSVWESYNAEPEKLDHISATNFRSMDILNSENTDVLKSNLVVPELIQKEAQDARDNNPDAVLLSKLPVTMLDLTLSRLSEERGISTSEILHQAAVNNIEELAAAIKSAVQTPGHDVSGALKAKQSQERGKV